MNKFEIAKTCYAPCEAVQSFGSLMIYSAVHAINQPEKIQFQLTTVAGEKIPKNKPTFYRKEKKN